MTFFTFLVKFSSDEVQTVFRESKSDSSKEIGFEATLKSVTKLKLFLGKARQSMQNCVNSKPDIESILENSFKTTLRSKQMF